MKSWKRKLKKKYTNDRIQGKGSKIIKYVVKSLALLWRVSIVTHISFIFYIFFDLRNLFRELSNRLSFLMEENHMGKIVTRHEARAPCHFLTNFSERRNQDGR